MSDEPRGRRRPIAQYRTPGGIEPGRRPDGGKVRPDFRRLDALLEPCLQLGNSGGNGVDRHDSGAIKIRTVVQQVPRGFQPGIDDAGNRWKTHPALRQCGNESAVGKMRNAARRRRDVLGCPKVQRFPQRALYRRRVERIAELLTAALGGSVGRHVHPIKYDNLESSSYLFVFALD